jgi:hypothetical protein
MCYRIVLQAEKSKTRDSRAGEISIVLDSVVERVGVNHVPSSVNLFCCLGTEKSPMSDLVSSADLTDCDAFLALFSFYCIGQMEKHIARQIERPES